MENPFISILVRFSLIIFFSCQPIRVHSQDKEAISIVKRLNEIFSWNEYNVDSIHLYKDNSFLFCFDKQIGRKNGLDYNDYWADINVSCNVLKGKKINYSIVPKIEPLGAVVLYINYKDVLSGYVNIPVWCGSKTNDIVPVYEDLKRLFAIAQEQCK